MPKNEPDENTAILTAEQAQALPKIRLFESRIDSADETERTIVSVINTPCIDRYNTVIQPRGAKLDNFRKNPVVLWCHDTHCAPIGRSLWVKYHKARNVLLAKTYFEEDDFADDLFKKSLAGTLSAWSIRMEPCWPKCGCPTEEEIKADKSLKTVHYLFREWELLEYSLVTVPGNPECLTERSLHLPADVRAAYADRLAFEAPTPEPAPPAVPDLPPLRGIRFEDYERTLMRNIRSLKPGDVAARIMRDTLDLARGQV